MMHLPIHRFGHAYRSLETATVAAAASRAPLALVSQANAGLIRRDLRNIKAARAALRQRTTGEMVAICARAADLFLHADLALDDGHTRQSADQYVAALSASSGLTHTLCRGNMAKIHTALAGMAGVLRGLTRGLDEHVLDTGHGEQAGLALSYTPLADVLGVVLPSNSPGVNSIWLPAIALRVPVALKPGREEPWTPLRIMAALIAAGCPRAAFGFYPTDHEGANAILTGCGRVILFGDDATTRAWDADPRVATHGTGRSKVLLGHDVVDDWADLIDVLASSVLDNGGRSCINASCIIVPRHGDAIADALARRLGTAVPLPADHEAAVLAAFARPEVAAAIDAAIDRGLATAGAEDITARRRSGPRRVVHEGLTYLLPTIVRCDTLAHPLANTEFLFPFASVVEMPLEAAIERLGPTLAATIVTTDADLISRVSACAGIERLNIGPIPTSRVQWDQPHEGNLFELLYRRRAIQWGQERPERHEGTEARRGRGKARRHGGGTDVGGDGG